MVINKDLRITDGAYYNLDLDTIAKNAICSTDEIIVGRWIDGKPIYRKIYYNNNYSQQASKTVYIDFPIPNLKEMINVSGALSGRGGVNWSPIQALWANASGMEYSTSIGNINESTFRINTGSANPLDSVKIRIIFEYTKTTD